MLQLALALGLTLPALAGPSAAHETAAEHLHRRGVHCMDVLERNDCAIEKFEALMQERTNERELVTDGMLRLISLYQHEGRADDVGPLLRRFWDAGRKRGSAGHVPWSTRFFPSELDVMINIDTPRIAESGAIERLGDDARDALFTCDEARREELEAKRRRAQAERVAARRGKTTEEVLREQDAERAEREAARGKGKGDPGPIFLEVACPIARAFDQTDLLGWTRMTGAMHHHDATKSLAVAQIPGLAARLSDAQARGTIWAEGDHWILVGTEYAGAPVHLASLDRDELLAAPAAMIDDVLEARGKRRKQINRELDKLVSQVPRDTAFFVVMTGTGLREIAFSGTKRSSRAFLQALLPRPKGLQVAGLMTDTAALFTRVPTDTPVKAKMLAGLANRLLWRAGDDPEAAAWLDGLDIAESSDRKALLMSYLVPSGKLGELFGTSPTVSG